MGSKNNPGAYNCYANAHPDEPMFILLGRDDRAPPLVEEWARVSEERGTDPAKVTEARACADAMRAYRANGPPTKGDGPALEDFLRDEEPGTTTVARVAALISGSLSSTTNLLLATAIFYETVEADPGYEEMKRVAAAMLRRFAREFAEHERVTL